MQFLHPTFLYALAALAIPIIIHLFYFRRFKKVYFTNVRFLKEVKEETSARRKLRNLLVLLMRLLALAFLVLAFAQPFIPQDTEVKKGEKNVSIFIDNSFSMNSLSEDVPLLEKARQRARQVIEAYGVEDRFQILTNDFEGRHQRLVSKEDALGLIEEVQTSPAVRELSKVLQRQKQALDLGSNDNKIAYLISDFQRNISDLNRYRDTTFEINLIPLQSVQEKNISIDSCWFDAPVQMINQTNTLVVRIQNHSDQEEDNIRLSLQYDGQVKPVGTLRIPPRASITDTVNMTILQAGWQDAELKITDFPVQFDDTYYFTFNVARQIQVLVINEAEPNKYLDAAFAGVSYFQVTNQSARNISYATLPNYQLIILNGLRQVSTGLGSELQQYVSNGGNVLVFPGASANLASYNGFLTEMKANELERFEVTERSVADINTEEFIFNDVFENQRANLKLPVTQANFKLSNYGSRGEERLLIYRDGNSYLGKYRLERGHLYLCAAPLEESYNNLARSGEIFIPMLYKMAISTAKDQRIAYTIGQDELIEADNRTDGGEIVYKLKGRAEEFIPEQTLTGPKVLLGINNQVRESGFYDLYLRADSTLSRFAFNYDRKESALAYYNETDLGQQLSENMHLIGNTARANLTEVVGERSQGIVLWRWCLILALIFLALETLLLRFWRV
ncbi:MAG: BatA domain-containing protein [Bacteroidota bacterium]